MIRPSLACGALSLSLSACSLEGSELQASAALLCVSERYAVAAVTSSPGTLSAFDSSHEKRSVRAFIGHQELAESIPGYLAAVTAGEGQHLQPLYLMVSDGASADTAAKLGQSALQALSGSERLARQVDSSRLDWAVFEKIGASYVPWGNCSDDFHREGGFDCLREVVFDDLKVIYPIHRQNLSIYPEVDLYIRDKLASWKCNP